MKEGATIVTSSFGDVNSPPPYDPRLVFTPRDSFCIRASCCLLPGYPTQLHATATIPFPYASSTHHRHSPLKPTAATMSDLGRRPGLGPPQTSSREDSTSEQQNPDPTSPARGPPLESRSFVRKRSGEARTHARHSSFDGHPGERYELQPSLLSHQPATSPFYDGSEQPPMGAMGDAQIAAVQAMAMASGGNDQGLLSPRSQSSTDPTAGLQRPNRPRGLFKAPSFLNLRSNSSFASASDAPTALKAKKADEGDGRPETPNAQSPRSSSPWFEFGGLGRKVSSRNASNKSGGQERSQDQSTDAGKDGNEYSTSAPSAVPSLHPGASNASSYFATAETSPKAGQKPLPALKQHN